ncbi:MAG: DNA polymerase III subunit gamma/tau [Flavobacteriales bacterium]|jgi:DNA polymerase-3 subunit gamma/tau
MSDFLVSARKYRPKTFDRVIGQDAITSTLKSAISQNQLAQSFLFCGPRGVGKTSLARILAKTINCEKMSAEIIACDDCVSCTSFNENSSFNVHELDAASNNSVDDIRNLVDQVRFAPQVGAYNIYIIDEVHMLSQSAFNAFLKTLEEPPKHAKFILATTEKHKIIPTILSRCQIFDFKRVGTDDIVKNLQYVAEMEKISTDLDALQLIAEKSDGALRDSLSLFDRLVSFSEKTLKYQDVITHLNILDYDYYFKITDQLIENNISALLVSYNEIINNGFDGQNFINGLANHLRDLLLCQDTLTVSLLNKNNDLEKRYLAQATQTDTKFLVKALKLTNECDIQYKLSNNQRLLVEICLMQISSIGQEVEVKKKHKNFIVSQSSQQSKISDDSSLDAKKNDDNYKSNFENEIQLNEIEDIIVDKTIKIITEKKAPVKDELVQEYVKRDVIKPKTISILNVIDEEDNLEILDTPSKRLRSDLISENIVLEKWKEMIVYFNDKEKSNLAITLGINKPLLNAECNIEITLSNSSQIELINQEKHNVLRFLRDKLNNDLIDLVAKVAPLTKDNTPYTNSDKFKKMSQDNKHLEKLRQELGLDPDY